MVRSEDVSTTNPVSKQGCLCSRELALCVGLWNGEGRPEVFIATHPVGAVSGSISALSPTLSPEITGIIPSVTFTPTAH